MTRVTAALVVLSVGMSDALRVATRKPLASVAQRRAFCTAVALTAWAGCARAEDDDDLGTTRLGSGISKPKYRFPDFQRTRSGLQYKDYKVGTGDSADVGDRVVIDWDGVTLGYQGRYIQTRNKPKGGAFEGIDTVDFLTFKVGDGKVIPGVDEAVRGMQPGGIRRIIVPEEIGYPADGFARIGPKPSSFSGQRALDFVLSSKDSTMMDKTLMFDIKLVKVQKR